MKTCLKGKEKQDFKRQGQVKGDRQGQGKFQDTARTGKGKQGQEKENNEEQEIQVEDKYENTERQRTWKVLMTGEE